MNVDLNGRVSRRSLRIGLTVVALVTVLAGIAGPARAQTAIQARVTIDFSFVAGGKDLPAGVYELTADPGSGRVVLQSKDGKVGTVMLPVITRLGRHDNDRDPEVVFDKIGGKSILSEVWLPGNDGYLLNETKEDHEHRVIGGSHPHK
jgi:hypothetical protein